MASSRRPFFDIHVDPPTSPDLSLVRLFHRNEESFVTFMRRQSDAKELRTLRQVQVRRLVTGSPKHEHLRTDSYFSINGFRSWGTRKTNDLLALNAAAVDLDFYRGENHISWQEAVATVETAIRDAVIPAPSLIVKSGQGAWLVWLLVADDDPARAPTAPTSNRLLLRSINERLAAVIAANYPQLGADCSSAELTRSLRIHGSVNSKAMSHVNFVVHRTPWDSPLTYTLDRLAGELNVQAPSFRREQRSLRIAKLPSDRGGKKRGGGANLSREMKVRLTEIEKIAEARGGFSEGHRNHAALIIAATLRSLHREPEDITEYLTRFAERCRPPLSASEVRGATAPKRYRFTNTTIASRLGVTAEEAKALELQRIRPDFRPKRADANVSKGRKTAAGSRRDALREIIADLDEKGRAELPSLRHFVRLLSEREIKVTPRTVAKDLDQLGIARSHRRGKMKPNACQLQLA